VPVGLRADWKPGQPYNLPTTPATTTNSGSSSNTSGNTSGTYYPDGTFVPKSGSSSSNTNKNSPETYRGSNNTNQPTPQSSSLRDYLGKYGITPNYDPATNKVTINGKSFSSGSIPGAYFDPTTGYNYVSDEGLFNKTFGLTAPSTPKPYGPTNNNNPAPPPTSSSFDWESLFNKLAPKNDFVAPSDAQMRGWASGYASTQVDPLITAIQNNLAQQLAAQETAKSDIEAAYAGLPEKYAAQLEEARRTALESAIARGMGRSGVVDWQTTQYSKPILESQRQSEADKAAKLAAIANTIAALNTTAQNSLTAAEQQRGALEAARMGELEQWAAQMAATGGQNNFNNMMQMANLYNNNQANSQNLILQLLPLLMGGAS
jgi:hypothetical protein